MKALLSLEPGPAETLVLADVPEPRPGPGEARIAVYACAINYPDVLIIEDRYQIRPPRPFAPGAEAAGVVDAVGKGVSQPRVGDRVIGFPGWGGLAEKLVLGVDRCIAIPDGAPFDEAAALMMTYGTALYGLKHRGGLQAGERLLVLGAGGGVGLAAVEVGKALGAEVIAAASSSDKAEAARAAGADRTLVYPRGPFDLDGKKALSALIKGACPGGIDAVFDPVGGDYAEAALRSLLWEGRLLVVGFPAGIPQMPLNLVLLKSCQVIGVAWGAVAREHPALFADVAAEVVALHASGAVRPRITERLPLERAAEAIARLAAREAVGKSVIVF
ncbi:MAG TPA: NADPH:quinone oxidoreductase family protein [Caulobacteraceae bacterium]